ncbi:uncharacterized protein [Triticum aestivum]|uniref:uncharacterized protein n=1 Tax=Triticum aestivum TaxID=4565 RepID=UPI001D01DA93|nr:uncharacterized protein LOC123138903 [Triticum aestivum]
MPLKTPCRLVYSTRGPSRFVKKKEDHRKSTGSPPLPLAHGVIAAATTHAGRFRRPPATRNTPPSSPWSGPASPPARFSAPVLCRPLPTPLLWLGFRAGLRRRVSGGPSYLDHHRVASFRHRFTHRGLHRKSVCTYFAVRRNFVYLRTEESKTGPPLYLGSLRSREQEWAHPNLGHQSLDIHSLFCNPSQAPRLHLPPHRRKLAVPCSGGVHCMGGGETCICMEADKMQDIFFSFTDYYYNTRAFSRREHRDFKFL